MTAALPLVARPLLGESLSSFVFRLADANAVPVRRVMQMVSRTRRPHGWSDTQWAKLARLAFANPSEIEPLRRRTAELSHWPNAVVFLGHPIRTNFLVRDRLRICPHCVKEHGMLREAWSLTHAPVCLDHEVELVDTCSCGRLLSLKGGGRSGGPFSCTCGVLFADLKSRRATSAALDALRWLTFRLNPALLGSKVIRSYGQLRPPFVDMPVADVISAIDLIGLAATTPREEDKPATRGGGYLNGDTRHRQGIEVALRCVEAAMPIVQGWPEAYYDLLATIAGRNPDPPHAHDPFATRIGRMLRRPYRGLDGSPIACLTDAVREFLTLKFGLRPRKRTFTMESRTARLVARRASRAATARRFGVDDAEPVFQRIYEATLRVFDTDDSPITGDLSDRFLAEAERRWFEAKSMMSATDASLFLEHPKHGHDMDPWIHPDLLTPAAEASEIHLCRRRPSFRFEDVYAMRRRLADQAIEVQADRVPAGYVLYSKITSRICCGGYSKQALLLDMVSGKISTARTIPEPRLCDLYLNCDQARDCSIAVRFRVMIEKDPFCTPNIILRLLAEFWPGQPNLESGISWCDLRRAEVLRYRAYRNTTGGRDRPAYHYSLVDCLERQYLLSGASISPSADVVIAVHRRTRRPDKQPRLIAGRTI